MIRRLRALPTKRRSIKLLALLASMKIALIIVMTLAALAVDVREQVRILTTAHSDGTQWITAQTDVELLALLVSLHQMQHAEPEEKRAARDDLRQRYDVFYGRIRLMRDSPLFDMIDVSHEASKVLDLAEEFLAWSAPYIDGPPEILDSKLPVIEERLTHLRPQIRSFSVITNRIVGQGSDARRNAARETITNIALVTLALMVLLITLSGVLAYLMRRSRQHAFLQARTRSRLQSIISTSLDALLVIDAYGRVVDYNRVAQELFGHPRATALGMALGQLIVSADEAEGQSSLPRPSPGLQQVQGIRSDGSRFPAECSIGILEDREGVSQVIFLRDITERLAAKDALVEARDRALAGEKAKADMLAVMSHEMRTPLNGILGTLDLMGDFADHPDQAQYLRVIRSSGELLLTQVNDVLDIARFDAGMMPLEEEDFDLPAMLQAVSDIIHGAALQRDNSVVVQQTVNLPRFVHGDRKKLRQVLINLLGNANKFTQGGRITLGARRLKAGWIEVSVSDTGIGIAPEHLERIFEEFVTIDSSYGRGSHGSGLGLAITRRLVDRMGGRIEVESTPGEGSHFRVVIPVAHAYGTPEPVAERIIEHWSALEVLLVEDNLINRFVARGMLERDGHKVIEAVNSPKAIEAAMERRFDLILLDIGLPGMDGTAVARHLRSTEGPNRKTRIVALTAHALPSDRDRFTQAGIDDLLTKPLTKQALRQITSQLDADLEAMTAEETLATSQLTELYSTLGPEVYMTLKTRFVAEVSAGIAELPLTNAGVPQAELAHRLAGSAALFGARRLHGILAEIETAFREGECPADCLRRLPRLWEDTQTALNGFELELLETAAE